MRVDLHYINYNKSEALVNNWFFFCLILFLFSLRIEKGSL